MWATEAAAMVGKMPRGTLLDVGCGEGNHYRFFRDLGFSVATVDNNRNYRAHYKVIPKEQTFDYVWCSHTLEHIPNVQLFLKRLIQATKVGGTLAITVPPAKTSLVGGHLTLWTPALLAYNIILAGLDLSQAQVGVYGYNISIVTKLRFRSYVRLFFDRGDVESLSKYFPWPDIHETIDGNLPSIRWEPETCV